MLAGWGCRSNMAPYSLFCLGARALAAMVLDQSGDRLDRQSELFRLAGPPVVDLGFLDSAFELRGGLPCPEPGHDRDLIDHQSRHRRAMQPAGAAFGKTREGGRPRESVRKRARPSSHSSACSHPTSTCPRDCGRAEMMGVRSSRLVDPPGWRLLARH